MLPARRLASGSLAWRAASRRETGSQPGRAVASTLQDATLRVSAALLPERPQDTGWDAGNGADSSSRSPRQCVSELHVPFQYSLNRRGQEKGRAIPGKESEKRRTRMKGPRSRRRGAQPASAPAPGYGRRPPPCVRVLAVTVPVTQRPPRWRLSPKEAACPGPHVRPRSRRAARPAGP